MNRLRVAVIGLGNWGECHVEAYHSIPNVDIVAICDTKEERLNRIGESFGIADRYTDAKKLLRRTDIHLVSVVTFEDNHLQWTLEALNSGKHVLVEKPVSTKLSEAKSMLSAAVQNHRRVMPGHLLRFESRYAAIYQSIQSGRVGQPLSMYFRRARTKGMFSTYHRTHTAYLSVVHDLDLAIWYTGNRVTRVKAYGNWVTGSENPDVFWALVQFENGAIACFNSNWMTPDQAGIVMNDSIEIIGKDGAAQFDNRSGGLELWDEKGRFNPDLSVHRILNGKATGALRQQLEYVCDSIRQDSEPSYVSFVDAIHGIEVANAMVESAATGQEITLDTP